MKKIITLIVGLLACLMVLVGCGSAPTQPGTFVAKGENRFILVDKWNEGNPIGHCYVCADKVTGVMYLYTTHIDPDGISYRATMTPLYNTDGTLMIYDEG